MLYFPRTAGGPLVRRGQTIVLLLASLVHVPHALALNVQLRWQPIADPRIVGYHVYSRPPRTPYGTPQDVGLPAPSADGSMSYVLRNLAANIQYFAVSGYTSDGVDGPISNESSIGTPDACAVDSCSTPTSCDFSNAPDGTTCGATGSDPCGAICMSGACQAATGTPLTTGMLRVSAGSRGGHIAIRSSFAPSAAPAPAATGLTVTVRDAGGNDVYTTAVPSNALAGSANGKAFAYRPSGGRASNGLQQLMLRHTTSGWTLRMRARDSTLTALPPTPLTWAVVLGTQCASDTAVPCVSTARAVTCRSS